MRSSWAKLATLCRAQILNYTITERAAAFHANFHAVCSPLWWQDGGVRERGKNVSAKLNEFEVSFAPSPCLEVKDLTRRAICEAHSRCHNLELKKAPRELNMENIRVNSHGVCCCILVTWIYRRGRRFSIAEQNFAPWSSTKKKEAKSCIAKGKKSSSES